MNAAFPSFEAWLSEYGAPDACAARLLCDRHPADAIAATVVEGDLSVVDVTFGELRAASERLAAGLAALGVGPGDRVAGLLPKRVELLTTVLAVWRLGAVYVPLFTAFSSPAIAFRLQDSAAKVVVCDETQQAKLRPGDDIPADPPWQVVVVGAGEAGDIPFADLLAADGDVEAFAAGGDAPLVRIYTSGTTGTPKGVDVPMKALAGFHAYLAYGLDLRDDDVYWNAADPGWAYGLYYAVVAPLLLGHRTILLHAPFEAGLTWRVLGRLGVTNFAAAPTVYRALRASAERPGDLGLRCCSSAGEPLTPEVNAWAKEALGVPVHDHYGQTELGMVVCNHHHPSLARPLKEGSMGVASPGWAIAVLADDADTPVPAGTSGRVAVDVAHSPLFWFGGYAGSPERTAERFSADGRYYFTGDVATRDAEGDLYFSARDDDVIIMAGYRIGPFEVESVLTTHPSVVEAAAVGAPDELRGEVVVAFVVPAPGAEAGPGLVAELQQLVKQRLASHAYPRRVEFVEALPKTPSGKVQRYALRESLLQS